MPRAALALGTALAVLTCAPHARAYRPFDSTDASVTGAGTLELEIAPLGYVYRTDRHFLVTPGLIANLGFAPRWEVVLQGRNFVLLNDVPGEPLARLTDTGLFLKGVLHEGSLQGASGPSVAVETGFLLPTINGDPGIGATFILIASQRWDELTLHLNAAATLTRAGNADVFVGIIVEGPHGWSLRPIAEVFVEHEASAATTLSGLVGLIWRAHGSVSVDLGARAALVGDAAVFEARAGLTWTIALTRPT